MENPFKEIIHDKKVPELLKEKLIKDIRLINLALDISDLFLVKYPDSIGELFKTK